MPDGAILCLLLVVFVPVGIGTLYRRWRQRSRAIPDRARRKRAIARLRKINAESRLLSVCSYGVFLVVWFLLLSDIFGWGGLTGRETSFLSPLALVFVAISMVYTTRSQTHRDECVKRLNRQRRMMCPDCYGSLEGVQDGGRCPECDYAFTPHSLMRDWADVDALQPLAPRPSSRADRAKTRRQKLDPLSSLAEGQGTMILLATFAVVTAAAGLLKGGFFVVYAVCGVAIAGGVWWIRGRRRRFFARLEREQQLLCPDCHYSLAGHAGGGRCPECGYEFTPESLRDDWQDVRDPGSADTDEE